MGKSKYPSYALCGNPTVTCGRIFRELKSLEEKGGYHSENRIKFILEHYCEKCYLTKIHRGKLKSKPLPEKVFKISKCEQDKRKRDYFGLLVEWCKEDQAN